MDPSSYRHKSWGAMRGSSGCLQSSRLEIQKVRAFSYYSSFAFHLPFPPRLIFIFPEAFSPLTFEQISILDEIFDTAFEVSVTIKGLEDSKLIPLDDYSVAKNRTRHLKCKGNNCEDFTILHMAWLEYSVSGKVEEKWREFDIQFICSIIN
jgi:hypothetical protein